MIDPEMVEESETEPGSHLYGSFEEQKRKIYIAGVGAVGKFMAHSLRGAPDPPSVELLFRHDSILEDWRRNGSQISITTDDVTVPHRGFGSDDIHGLGRIHGMTKFTVHPHAFLQRPPIYNLIICTKATQVVSVLDSIRHRLLPESTVCFMQNGMGIIEEVNAKVFTDPSERPNYVLGINSHGLTNEENWVAKHAGFGSISLGLPPSSNVMTEEDYADHPSRYLMRVLSSIPVLSAVVVSPTELRLQQLEKLSVNAIVNPLTALMDSRNGSLLYNYSICRVVRLLLAEISYIIRRLPELEDVADVTQRFSAERLETMFVRVAYRTGNNISSMLADVRNGRQLEAKYINGYIVKRGEELGFAAVNNYAVMHMVTAKQQMITREITQEVPVLEEWRDIISEEASAREYPARDIAQQPKEQEGERDEEPNGSDRPNDS